MGDMGEQANFSGGGGSLSTRGNPAQKLLCFLDKTMNIHGTRATTLTSQLLHVMTTMFMFPLQEFPLKLFVNSSLDDKEDH